jgi:hypothetical protein
MAPYLGWKAAQKKAAIVEYGRKVDAAKASAANLAH